MPMSTNTQKLRVLRARTDHDLLVVVSRELNRAFALVGVATNRNSPLFSQAEKALGTAKGLLLRISGLSDGDRQSFESRMSELKGKLEQVPAHTNVHSYPASFAS
jgi:hypothetical protein